MNPILETILLTLGVVALDVMVILWGILIYENFIKD